MIIIRSSKVGLIAFYDNYTQAPKIAIFEALCFTYMFTPKNNYNKTRATGKGLWLIPQPFHCYSVFIKAE